MEEENTFNSFIFIILNITFLDQKIKGGNGKNDTKEIITMVSL